VRQSRFLSRAGRTGRYVTTPGLSWRRFAELLECLRVVRHLVARRNRPPVFTRRARAKTPHPGYELPSAHRPQFLPTIANIRAHGAACPGALWGRMAHPPHVRVSKPQCEARRPLDVRAASRLLEPGADASGLVITFGAMMGLKSYVSEDSMRIVTLEEHFVVPSRGPGLPEAVASLRIGSREDRPQQRRPAKVA
jgi:hypothetical protein